MKLRGGLTAISLAIVALVAAAPADAASTRAEYVAQVEPLCQAAAGPASQARANLSRSLKRLFREAKSGSTKSFLRSLQAVVRAIYRYNQIDDVLTAQLEGVAPAAADLSTVAVWLQGRRDYTRLAGSAAVALQRLKVKRFFNLIARANSAYKHAISPVSDFGFVFCLYA